ncbi:unnamed protein product [Rotaria sordida]|uniref:Uncharacterized protein n=1 Tax=Rotaria sordida TaxID=392033 RepID=A0A819XAI8_9BILA|nr:unnamed protein product [Rotaria sordida]
MKQLRNSHAQIYFQDESWINLGDVRKNIWVYEGKGPLRQNDGKEEHNMDSDQFVNWIEDSSRKLRILHGNEAKIAIVQDNASWHNVLTLESKVLKRSWRKGQGKNG